VLTERQILGLKGERIAAEWLRRRGWTILAHRFRAGHRDIDLIAARYDAEAGERVVAFVEVRTKTSVEYGFPIETVRRKKQQELRRAARVWIASNRRSRDVYRFDFVGVVVGGDRPDVEHVIDVF
jgi:putative endonuclease